MVLVELLGKAFFYTWDINILQESIGLQSKAIYACESTILYST
jgi:hypothetical protein